MTTEEDAKKKTGDDAESDDAPADSSGHGERDERGGDDAHQKVADLALRGEDPAPVTDDHEHDVTGEPEEAHDAGATPHQLGYKRFVYAAYLAGAIAIAFLGSKAVNAIWARLAAWKPQLGEPRDEIVMPIAAIAGAATALYYWKQSKTRQYAEEVASELSQVTWPSRKEVTNSTTVVIVTTAFATVFFALMDRFWGFVTNLVYGT